MNTDYKVGDLIYDASIYDGLNTFLSAMAKGIIKIKPYHGRIPACGVFCGGCPTYIREKRPCKGAELSKARCEKCKTFHLCCIEKKLNTVINVIYSLVLNSRVLQNDG